MGEEADVFATAALPRWLQVSERLIREIGAGRLADGARLPPERDMAADLGIAVGTLRKALADLAAKGLLERRQGSGNYVRHRVGVPSVYSLFRLELTQGGGLPTAELIAVERRAKPADAPAFGLSPEAYRIRRLRRLDGEAVALEEIWLDAVLAPALRAEDLSESLYLSYRGLFGIEIARVEDRIGVAPVPDWTHRDFASPSGASVGYIVRLAALPDGTGAEYSRTWFDPDRARYVSRMTKELS
ncbi:MAG: Transcriptional regulator, GntR family [uncultured Rubellimicrobium sp.]|jgi:GntR family transcriptional regulator|uniref:Transcriptional regulator, GntR family n=1 Tax=uncultured Rubellimicrobium sp. TaxID=543078 RepID=A0A6J4ND10_9RHOB|nr:MAG: Transcriptional regulator, GntR family [uncultured Rubellimicrobium sp.]